MRTYYIIQVYTKNMNYNVCNQIHTLVYTCNKYRYAKACLRKLKLKQKEVMSHYPDLICDDVYSIKKIRTNKPLEFVFIYGITRFQYSPGKNGRE